MVYEPVKNEKSDVACRLCGKIAVRVLGVSMRNRPTDLFLCDHCDYLQTEQPTWLDQAYSDNPIDISDTGILQRQVKALNATVATYMALGLSGPVLDDAGGYGLLVRRLRDHGLVAFWHDAYTQNLFARGFEWHHRSLMNATGRPGMITLFEVLEHLVDPVHEMAERLKKSDHVLLSTTLRPEQVPQEDWVYYGLDHGQHVGFFSVRSLEQLAMMLKVRVLTDGKTLHLFTRSKLSYWKWKLYLKMGMFWPFWIKKSKGSLTLADQEAAALKSTSNNTSDIDSQNAGSLLFRSE